MKTIEIATSQLIGQSLDWAVCKLLGIEASLRIVQRAGKFEVWHKDDVFIDYKGESQHTCEGKRVTLFGNPAFINYSTHWGLGGPLTDTYKIVMGYISDTPCASLFEDHKHLALEFGETKLIAAMRVLVRYKLGDAVAVPLDIAEVTTVVVPERVEAKPFMEDNPCE